MNTIGIITAARSLRRATEARAKDRDDAEAEHDARLALLNLASALDVTLHPSRPVRWIGTDDLARHVETAAEALAEAAEGDWQHVGCIATLALRFGALANRMGCELEPDAADDDARAAIEGERIAAE